MQTHSQLSRTLIAIVAALAASTVAVGSAVGPAGAVSNPVGINLNA